MSSTDIPHFEHDCYLCVFLGNYSDKNYPKADLYWCHPVTVPTVIVRYGDDPSANSSGMVFANNHMNDALVEAKRRAVERGLQVERDVIE